MELGAGVGIVVFLFILLIGSIALLSFIFWIWMLIDCASNEPSEGNDKMIWMLVIIFLQGLGALVYFFARRPKRKELYGK